MMTIPHSLSLEKSGDGVAVLRIDVPGKVNVLGPDLLAEYEQVLSEIEDDPAVLGCVIVSGKPEGFVAGADLTQLLAARSEEEVAALSRQAQAMFRRMERSHKPLVAAIHGAALGGGVELALACHARVATDDPKTVLVLPEVSLGLIPGAGGTQRLPRLIGLRAALPMLLTGQRVRAQRALTIGLIDAIAPSELLLQTARDFVRELPQAHRLGWTERLLRRRPFRRILLERVRRGVLARTRGLYPAPLAILDCIESGFAHGAEAGFEAESRHFSQLAVSRGARNLVRLFLESTHARKLSGGAIPRKIERVGVLGAGLMGEGIASVSLPLARVLLKDVSEEALERAGKNIEASLARRVVAGSLTGDAAASQRASLLRTTSANDFRGCDLVIEAVFEDLELKQRVLAELEDTIAPAAVYASNTSALPIARIAKKARHPERVLGMHYFSPVPRMQLLEIVVADKTEEWAVSTAQAFGIAQGKTVILVKDSPGFYTTRILAPYINEAVMLLDEGAGMREVDEVLEAFGFAVGPLSLLNKVGIDVAAHVSADLGAAFSDRGMRPSATLERLARERKRFSERDFPRTTPHAPRDILDRVSLSMVNEAVQCLSEGVIASESDGDLGAVLGLGFPPFRGGPFRYLRDTGAAEVAERLHELADQYGQRFTPAEPLVDRASTLYR